MTKTPTNIGASAKARLLKLSKERREDYQLLLARYANERLLHRLSVSPYASSFVLKGAALFTLWTGRAHRATRDIDLLGFGEPTEVRLRAIFDEVLRLEVVDDGVRFDVASLDVGPIREDQEYGGVRITLRAEIGSALVRLQVDVGFGDAITPGPELVEFPPLLDFDAPKMRAYPRSTVVAEKLEAMVKLGIANSRMKDFFDVVIMSRTFSFDGVELVRAIRATFERRRTELPEGLPQSPHRRVRRGRDEAHAVGPIRAEGWCIDRAAKVNDLVTRSISGHMTEQMQRQYSTVTPDEHRASIGNVVSLFGVRPGPKSGEARTASGEQSKTG